MIIIVFIFAFLSAVFSSHASAADAYKFGIARCAAVSGSTERLSCYDALANRLGIAGGKSISVTQPPKKIGKWRIETEKSPIDDSENVYLTLDSNDTISTILGSSRPTLVARCKENNTNVYVAWGVYLGLSETDVLVRLDSERAIQSNWSISTDNQATFYNGSDIDFLKSLADHKKLLLQVTPYGDSPAMVSFNLEGVSEALIPLKEACGWQ